MRMTFAEQCALGEQADALLAAGRHADARAAYESLSAKIEESKRVDSFIVSKVALGLLLTRIEQGDLQGAHSLWLSSLEDDRGHGVLGIGIHGLETGQTSVHDLMVYFLISAYMHSLSSDPKAALVGVNDFMKRVMQYAFEEDPELLPLALNNWRLHLKEVFNGEEVPARASHLWMEAQLRYGKKVPEAPIAFPKPSRWVIDWGEPDAPVTEFGPDGSVRQVGKKDS
jgi:hypothetical protein